MYRIVALALAFLAPPVVAAPAANDGSDAGEATRLLASADAPRRLFLDSRVLVRATISLPDKDDKVSELELLIGNEDQQLVIFHDSSKAADRKFLMLGDKSWLLVPGSTHPIAISPNQRMLGSMSFADLGRINLIRDYTATVRDATEPCTTEGSSDVPPCRVLDISASTRSAPYAAGTLWINQDGLAVRAIFSLPSGKPAKAVEHQYVRKNGAWTPARTSVQDLLLRGKPMITTLEYLQHQPTSFPANTFDAEHALTH